MSKAGKLFQPWLPNPNGQSEHTAIQKYKLQSQWLTKPKTNKKLFSSALIRVNYFSLCLCVSVAKICVSFVFICGESFFTRFANRTARSRSSGRGFSTRLGRCQTRYNSGKVG